MNEPTQGNTEKWNEIMKGTMFEGMGDVFDDVVIESMEKRRRIAYPTIDEVLSDYFNIEDSELGEDKFKGHHDKARAKQQLTQLIADIVGEDMKVPPYDPTVNPGATVEWQELRHDIRLINASKAEQRQIAKERGIEL